VFDVVKILHGKYRCDQKILMQMIRTANELKTDIHNCVKRVVVKGGEEESKRPIKEISKRLCDKV
jgi:hypothetical protein